MRTTRTTGPKTPDSKRMGWKNYVTIGGTTAAVAALLFLKTCSGGPISEGPMLAVEPQKPVAAAVHEEPKECIQVTKVVQNVQRVSQIEWVEIEVPRTDCVPCELPPIAGDGVVELNKGEGESRSPRHDPAESGRCGDGVHGPLEIPNADAQPRARQEGEPLFTPDDAKPVVCLADTHCGDGIVQRNVITGVEVPVTREDGTVVYEFATVKINEVCDPAENARCKDDCSGWKPQPVRAARAMPTPECDESVNREISRRIETGVSTYLKSIRPLLGADDRAFIISVTVDVDASGTPVVRDGAVTCGSGDCPVGSNQQKVIVMATKLVGTLDTGQCTGRAHRIRVEPETRD